MVAIASKLFNNQTPKFFKRKEGIDMEMKNSVAGRISREPIEAVQTSEEQFLFFKSLREGSAEEKIIARNAILLENLDLIERVTIATYKSLSFESSVIDIDDLIQESCVRIFKSIERFDYAKGVRLRTYLYHRIRGSVLDVIRGQSFLSRSIVDKAKDILKGCEGAVISDQSFSEIEKNASRLNMTTEEAMRIIDDFRLQNRFVSIDQPIENKNSDNEIALHERIPDTRPTPLEEIAETELNDFVKSILENTKELSQDNKKCLTLYFGLTDDGSRCSANQIAESRGVTNGAISHRISLALKQLRKLEHWEIAREFIPSLLPPPEP